MFSENVELTFKVLCVEMTVAGGVTVAIGRAQDDEGLQDERLLARGCRTEDSSVRRDLAPSENSEVEVSGKLGEHGLLLLQADRIASLEKHIAHSVLTGFWQLAANVSLSLTLKEEMRDTGHYTRTISVSTICTSGATMGHRTEKLTSIGDNLVGLFTLDVTNEANTTSIFLVLVLIQTLAGRQGTRPGSGVALNGIETIQGNIFGIREGSIL